MMIMMYKMTFKISARSILMMHFIRYSFQVLLLSRGDPLSNIASEFSVTIPKN